MSGSEAGGGLRGDGERRRVGVLVASIPAALFLLSVAFVVLRDQPRPGACRHEHSAERVRGWWEKARENEIAVPGTRYVELDAPADGGPACIRVGLSDPGAQPRLERRFQRLEVPREVVIYERARVAGEAGGKGEDAP